MELAVVIAVGVVLAQRTVVRVANRTAMLQRIAASLLINPDLLAL
jgi:hypothetical protein